MTLTDRQMQVLVLLDAGLTQREIAAHLWLEHGTVRNHVLELRHRLGARTPAHAVGIGHRTGLLSPAVTR